jgi:hypothetical protein
MAFLAETTLAGYARAAVEMKTCMHENCASTAGGAYTHAFVETLLASHPDNHDAADSHYRLTEVIGDASAMVWAQGEAYVIAAMTVVIAAVAASLDLTSGLLTADAAPPTAACSSCPNPSTTATSPGRSAASPRPRPWTGPPGGAARIVSNTRVVMLRRTSAMTEPAPGPAKWHYRVRFAVRGHWRRLIDTHGRAQRVWVRVHLKGPVDAPLLHGEKVAVLAR